MGSVEDLYNHNPDYEWERLARSPYHTLEFTVFIHHITQYLRPNSFVLDAGGGPGRYTIELARRGHEVILLDLSREVIALAKNHVENESPEVKDRIKEFIVGDIIDLSRFDDETFDAVLCLDPLTYFIDSDERSRALNEIVRLGKRGAIIALSIRGYLAAIRTQLLRNTDSFIDGSLNNLISKGNMDVYGIPCHFFRAQEIRDFASAHGLELILMAGAQGLSDGLIAQTNDLFEDEVKWRIWEKLIMETSTDPTVVDMGSHLLYLGRKK